MIPELPDDYWTRLCRSLLLSLGLLLPIAGHGSDAALKSGGAAYQTGNYGKALEAFLVAARGGNAVAQYLVASMYAEGLGTTQSKPLALRWYRLAADQGDQEAQVALAELLLSVDSSDPAEIVRLLEAAATQGHGGALNRLGTMHLAGTRVPTDLRKASQWFLRGARAGNLDARYHLGRMHLGLQLEPSSPDAAHHWFYVAALAGHTAAQLQLGNSYAQGALTNANLSLSHAWLTIAAASGLPQARNNMAIVERQLTGAEQERAVAELDRLRVRRAWFKRWAATVCQPAAECVDRPVR